MKKKAPTTLKLIRRDSISSDGGSISDDPDTPVKGLKIIWNQ